MRYHAPFVRQTIVDDILDQNSHPHYHRLSSIIIEHIDTLPKYGQKLSMYVGPHDVYLTIDVHFSIFKENAKIKSLSTIFSLQTLFCYQCVEL